MLSLNRLSLIALVSLSASGCSTNDEPPPGNLPPVGDQTESDEAVCAGCDLDTALAEAPETFGRWGLPVPGLTAAAYDFNGNFWAAAVGSEDPNAETPMTVDSKLRISSASKQFATILLLRLRADGAVNPTTGQQVSLDDKLSDYGCGNPINGSCGWGLDQFNPAAATNPIRLRHLSGNTSGIPKVLDQDLNFVLSHSFFGPAGIPGAVPGYSTAIPSSPIVAEQMIATFTVSWWLDLTQQAGVSGSPQWYAPGTRHEYNNLGHTLISLIAEELTGLPYRDALQVHLLARFGIDGISEETARLEGYAPGWGDGLVCYLTSNGQPYFDAEGQVVLNACTPNFTPSGIPGVDGCACNDNQGWTRLEGYYGSFGQGAGGVAATASGLADFLRKLHASHPGLGGLWGSGLLPAEEYAQLYAWECDNDDASLPQCEGFFHQYGRGFYSRYKVPGDASSGLVYGHEGGGHLPCKDMIDWSTGSIYVLQANRKTAQLNEPLMWSAYVDGLNAIGSSPSSLVGAQ